MKKRFPKSVFLALALALALGFSVPALATIKVNGETVPSPYTVEGDAQYVYAGYNDLLTVKGKLYNVRPYEEVYTVEARNGSTIEVTGKIGDDSATDAVYAVNSTVATGGINENFEGAGIYATNHSRVSAGGNVNENGRGDCVYASASTVEVLGQVLEAGPGTAVSANNGSVVTVTDRIWQLDDGDEFGYSLLAAHSKITAGGDVLGPVKADTYSEIIVEGSVKGDISKYNTGEAEGDGRLYIGLLAGNAAPEMKDRLHYLIGLAEGSASFDQITMTDAVSSVNDTVKGAKGKTYRYTSTCDLAGKSIVIKPKTACREFRIEGLPGGVKSVTENGSVILTFTDAFKGGMQNLNIVLVPEYTVTVTAGKGGSASADKTAAVEGETVTLKAIPAQDYEFDRWEVISGGVNVTDDQFIIGTSDVEIKAHFKAIVPPVAYRIIIGMNQTVYTNAVSAKFASDADFSKFDHVEVDGRTVAKKYYTAESGSTVITFNRKFIKNLSIGKHKLTIVSKDGSASTGFTVSAPLPPTGDRAHPALLIMLLFASVGTILLTSARARKRNEE